MSSNLKLLKDIRTILDKFTGNECQFDAQKCQAKTWEIGTNIYQSWMLMIQNANRVINSKQTNHTPGYFLVKTIFNKSGKNRYQFILNVNDNITPAKSKPCVSKSAARQYLQIGYCLGLVDRDNFHDGEKPCKIKLNQKFWEINLDKLDRDLTNQFLIALLNSVDSSIPHQRNFGLSLFLSLIDSYDQTIFGELGELYLFPHTERNKHLKDNLIKLNTENGVQFIRHVKGEDTDIYQEGKHTYTDLCHHLLDQYGFETIVDNLIKVIHGEPIDNCLWQDNSEFQSNKEKNFLNNKYRKKIKQKRAELRKKIIVERVGDIDPNYQYTDLENSPPNYKEVASLEACHIFDVNIIQNKMVDYIASTPIDKIDETVLDQIVNQVNDVNNGILMSRDCHKFFDHNYVWFDDQGYLVWQQDPIITKQIQSSFGADLDKVRIKPEVFSNDMKAYILNRNLNNKK